MIKHLWLAGVLFFSFGVQAAEVRYEQEYQKTVHANVAWADYGLSQNMAVVFIGLRYNPHPGPIDALQEVRMDSLVFDPSLGKRGAYVGLIEGMPPVVCAYKTNSGHRATGDCELRVTKETRNSFTLQIVIRGK